MNFITKYLSRKFLVTIGALLIGLYLADKALGLGLNGTDIGAIFGGIALITGPYMAGNAIAKGKDND